MRTRIRGTWTCLALVLIGTHGPATASCDISGSSVMLQGIEKRDATPTTTRTQVPAAQRSAQTKAEPRAASTATESRPSQ